MTFSDGTEIADVVSGASWLTISDLLRFETDSATIWMDDSGTAHLAGNSLGTVAITATTVCASADAIAEFYGIGVSSEVDATDNVYANLLAGTHQFNAGNALGAKYDPVATGGSIVVPIVFQTGPGETLSSIDFTLTYEGADLRATACEAGDDWAPYDWFFTCTTNDPEGILPRSLSTDRTLSCVKLSVAQA